MIVIEVLLVILGLIALYFARKFLGGNRWVMGWVRGSIGLAFVLVAALIFLVVKDFLSYKNLLDETALVTLSIEKKGEQTYTVEVDFLVEAIHEVYEIKGDLWQMDAKIIRWLGVFRAMGIKPGYKLDRLSGRYYSLEEERREDRTVYQLQEEEFGIDVWSWLQTNQDIVPWVDAVYGSATYLPLEDGAIYKVNLSSTGLVAVPVNKIAKEAVGQW